ncbi:hypothetical protein Q4E93_05155 [Flavitalea sp. BT771]|uniref:hypothetical protein n=1 Tax=Flavitalea sp. BT771 TaxID=3063329 RepID=UPI0026E2C946|nr:hypothetical protein [Flavitalea sp. BT771]MDO6429959.1 hypothetical protein [Flavitalea sp. BT771]MDV6217913.1 hypothetical protein [Flavitalea sp. BT771]
MKKVLAFLVLLSHMNTSMFLPQLPEVDAFDALGRKLDDINSVVEYVGVVLGYDTTADDEDDDTGQAFHIAKVPNYLLFQPVSIVRVENTLQCNTTHFAEYRSDEIKLISIETLTPPPEVRDIS